MSIHFNFKLIFLIFTQLEFNGTNVLMKSSFLKLLAIIYLNLQSSYFHVYGIHESHWHVCRWSPNISKLQNYLYLLEVSLTCQSELCGHLQPKDHFKQITHRSAPSCASGSAWKLPLDRQLQRNRYHCHQIDLLQSMPQSNAGTKYSVKHSLNYKLMKKYSFF